MATSIETTGTLGRKLQMALPVAAINKEVGDRLRQLARGVKMPGFRPGKVPMSMVERSYGAQVQAEVIGDEVSKAFSAAVDEHKLRVAGQPKIERRDGAPEDELGFTATFEVYPDVELGDLSGVEITRVQCQVGDAEVDKTIEILRKQRVTWASVERGAADQDRVTVDFVGRLDGVEFEGGSGNEFPVVIGAGRMLPDFEAGLRGITPGEKRTIDVAFPADYGSANLAGKTAQFEITARRIEGPVLPPLDAEFARQLGVADGDLAKMREEIKANLEREVGQRLKARHKVAVMDRLSESATLELPKALLDSENEALVERARQDLQARGVDLKNIPIPPDAFDEQARKRVRLGLIVAEVVKRHGLAAKPDQIRAQIEEFARTYENPGEVIRHYFSDRNRLAEVEALVVESNVVDWVLGQARVADAPITFDELMANG